MLFSWTQRKDVLIKSTSWVANNVERLVNIIKKCVINFAVVEITLHGWLDNIAIILR